MSRYRKIEVRTWSDEKFRRLSGMHPSGQSLWFFLLTGPHTTAIPGLFRAGRAAMAEELAWEVEAFDKAFNEVFEQGMAKADFKAKLIWLPNAIKHNKPESPNVVRGWRVELDLLPECDLKHEAIAGIREALDAAGPAYIAAFEEVIGRSDPSSKASAKASQKPSAKTMANQEQEQEQKKNTSSARADMPPGFLRFWSAWPKSPRKVAKAACAKRWRSKGLEAQADAIVANVGAMRGSRQWRDGFEPAPLTYLSQERWRDSESADQPRSWWLAQGYGSEDLARADGRVAA